MLTSNILFGILLLHFISNSLLVLVLCLVYALTALFIFTYGSSINTALGILLILLFVGIPITMIGILKLYILFVVSMTTVCIFCVYYVLSLTAISFGFEYATTYNFYMLGYVLCI